ncbi:MAG TPA: GAF domain-containing protein, partial [Candidatus Binatia bacterium]
MPKNIKKGSQSNKVKPRHAAVKAPLSKKAQTIAEVRRELAESLQREKAYVNELQDVKRQLTEALKQQTATSEILSVIAGSPTDIQPVLDVVAENAARLCGATDAQINRVEGDLLRRVASYGSMATPDEVSVFHRGHVGGRAVIDRQTIHIQDITAGFDEEFPGARTFYERTGVRTILATPLLREGDAIGNVVIRRTEVRPFTDKQIALLKTFADQAVIAIENVRLFQELQDRNRDLSEALEQQTATSEILGAISSSPADLQPVFETILANATRLCGTQNAALFRFDGEFLRFAAGHNLGPENMARMENYSVRPGTETASRRAALERRTIHVPDVVAAAGFDAYQTDTYRRENRLSTLAV